MHYLKCQKKDEHENIKQTKKADVNILLVHTHKDVTIFITYMYT